MNRNMFLIQPMFYLPPDGYILIIQLLLALLKLDSFFCAQGDEEV